MEHCTSYRLLIQFEVINKVRHIKLAGFTFRSIAVNYQKWIEIIYADELFNFFKIIIFTGFKISRQQTFCIHYGNIETITVHIPIDHVGLYTHVIIRGIEGPQVITIFIFNGHKSFVISVVPGFYRGMGNGISAMINSDS